MCYNINNMATKEKELIGRAEIVHFPELDWSEQVHARIDSGARTSSIWGEATVNDSGGLDVIFFGVNGVRHTFSEYGHAVVASSNGHVDKRFTVQLLVRIKSRKIRATFTIANRATQVYPVLIGRNVLRGKFIVDVKLGNVLKTAEKKRNTSLQSENNQERDNT
jgi:hypothetical protein